MTVQIVVSTADPDGGPVELPTGETLHGLLSNGGSATAYVSELLASLFEDVRQTISFDCDVDVTVSGSLKLVGKGEMKCFILNVGGSAETQTTMTVTLHTTVAPGR